MRSKKPRTLKARIVLDLEVDLDAWAESYGFVAHEVASARADAREHLGALVVEAVEGLPHLADENLAQVTKASVTADGIRSDLMEG